MEILHEANFGRDSRAANFCSTPEQKTLTLLWKGHCAVGQVGFVGLPYVTFKDLHHYGQLHLRRGHRVRLQRAEARRPLCPAGALRPGRGLVGFTRCGKGICDPKYETLDPPQVQECI